VPLRSTRPIRSSSSRSGRAWHPDIVSEPACVHLSIFEHAEIDRRTEQSVSDASAPKRPSACGASMRLIFRVSSIAGLCSGLSRRRSGVRARFSRVHLAQKWAPKRTASAQAAFLSLRMTMKSSEGGGVSGPRHRLKRVNRPPAMPSHYFPTPNYDLPRFPTPDGNTRRRGLDVKSLRVMKATECPLPRADWTSNSPASMSG
jgi:hypothetical protein